MIRGHWRDDRGHWKDDRGHWKDDRGHWRDYRGHGKTEVLGQKPSTVPLCSPHPKQIGMGSTPSLRLGLRRCRGIFLYGFEHLQQSSVGRDISVGTATGYGLDGPGIESQCGVRFSSPVQTGPGAHPASCTMGTGSFLGLKAAKACR